MRARAQIEERESSGKSQIVVTEIPYQVNKEKLVKADRRARPWKRRSRGSRTSANESRSKEGMRIVIELKRDCIPNVVLNQLYKHTAMQSTFGVIMLALDNGAPKVMNLKELLERFIAHRHELIVRRTKFDLDAAEAREHILEGSQDRGRQHRRSRRDHQEVEGRARCRRPAPQAVQADREADRCDPQHAARQAHRPRDREAGGRAQGSAGHRSRSSRRSWRRSRGGWRSSRRRWQEIAKTFGDDRRTEILADQSDFSVEDLIAEEDMVITISHTGYIKRISISTYKRQRRGGRGLQGATTKEEDWIEHLFIASTHDYLMFFTNTGQVYWLKVHEIPQGGRASRGKPVVNCIAIKPEERIAATVAVREFADDKWLMFATRLGTVKKTVLSAYGNVRSTGINAINIEDGDELIDVQLCDEASDIVLATADGMSIRFHQGDVREMGRVATGVKGIELEKGDDVIGMVVIRRDATLLVVSEKGFGKRSELADYRVQKRGGKGIITLKKTDKTGAIVALKEVQPDDELMLITRHGVIIRMPVEGIRVIGRNTQGVKVMNLDSGDSVVDVARVVNEDEEGAEAEASRRRRRGE